MAIVQIPSNLPPHVPFPPPPQNYLFETLPMPVVGSVYQTVPLSTILTQEFGKNLDGYKDFYIGYFGEGALQDYNSWLSFWTATPKGYDNWNNGKGPMPGVLTRWVNSNSVLLPADFDGAGPSPKLDFGGANVYHVTASTMGNYSLDIGTNIAPFAYILVPIAYDGFGKPTEFVQYSITTCDPSLVSPTLASGTVNPSDIAAAAKRFGAEKALADVKSPNDCHFIAQDISSAAGAPLADPTESGDPTQNLPGGFWRIVYRGSDPGAIQNWSSLVQPGDIVRMGWQGGGDHTFTVAAVNTTANADGSHNLEVYDNATNNSLNQLHWDTGDGKNTLKEGWTYDAAGIGDPSAVTIYRLTPDHLYLIQGGDTGSWLAGNGFNDDIIGGAGDDFLVGGAGNNVLDGGGGTNIAVFFGPRSEYDITSYTGKDGLVRTIVSDMGSAGDGTDDLVRIQHLQFADWTYALNGSQLTPLYKTLNDADVPPPQAVNPIFPHNLGSTLTGMAVTPTINPLPLVAIGGRGLTGTTERTIGVAADRFWIREHLTSRYRAPAPICCRWCRRWRRSVPMAA